MQYHLILGIFLRCRGPFQKPLSLNAPCRVLPMFSSNLDILIDTGAKWRGIDFHSVTYKYWFPGTICWRGCLDELVCATAHVWGSGDKLWSWASPSSMWVPGPELTCLVADSFYWLDHPVSTLLFLKRFHSIYLIDKVLCYLVPFLTP